jgi:hypothetical protein
MRTSSVVVFFLIGAACSGPQRISPANETAYQPGSAPPVPPVSYLVVGQFYQFFPIADQEHPLAREVVEKPRDNWVKLRHMRGGKARYEWINMIHVQRVLLVDQPEQEKQQAGQ